MNSEISDQWVDGSLLFADSTTERTLTLLLSQFLVVFLFSSLLADCPDVRTPQRSGYNSNSYMAAYTFVQIESLKMGYDVHITRAEHWTESDSNPIKLDEWYEYIPVDSEMRLDSCAEAEVDGDTLRYANEGLAVWTAFSGHGLNGNLAWFDFCNGAVVVKNPNEEILGKMKRIAAALHANVIGDEGEFY